MIQPVRLAVLVALFTTVAAGAIPRGMPRRQAASPPPLARVVWLEEAGEKPQQPGQLPVCRQIDGSDLRLKDYERWIDTEAARFARRLVYRAAQRFGIDPAFREPVLPVLVRKGGNNAAYAFAIQTPRGIEGHPALPYLVLDPSAAALGDTILHESGHLVHSLAARGRRGRPPWSAFPHTTFATTDPLTALAEGYGIHFETLGGHFGSDPARQAYYRRLAPSFEPGRGRNAEYFSPVADLMTFSQDWARYQAVRDGLPAFEGHIYADQYARTQMDPARDRARLKTPNAMLASEGVAASVLFWISAALAGEHGARPAGGLDQPALIDSEMILLEGIAALPPPEADTFRPDLLDLVQALGRANPHVGDIAVSRFVDITRGVTARPAVRAEWRTLYDAAIMLDLDTAKAMIAKMDADRGDIVTRARQDIGSLRAGVGPIIPVRVKGRTFELKALGEKMQVEFDLNAMSEAEMTLLPALPADVRTRIIRERERAPFASAADFASRAGCSLDQLGLEQLGLAEAGPKR